MSDVRPYRLDETTAIDMNLVTAMHLYKEEHGANKDKWIVHLVMYYSEPILLDFSTEAEAKMEFNKLFQVWGDKDA